ncbi:MAG: acetyl-CoA acetyltransferase [Myxococcota bacterium]
MTVFVLGGAQTDFAINWSRDGHGAFEMMHAAIEGALEQAGVNEADVGVAHVGNFAGELFSGQGHLGGFVASERPAFDGLPTGRHEAACASGSIATLAATADIAAGRYDVALVVGVEQMRNTSGTQAAEHLGAAAWAGREGQDATYLWPHMFSRLADEYAERFGLDHRPLLALSKQAFDHGRRNPNAQTRRWSFSDASFSLDDDANPVVEGRMRRQDCGQITDGAAAVVLASEAYATRWAAKHGRALEDVARIRGWGHRTSSMLFEDKVARTRGQRYVFPHLRGTLEDAWARAALPGSDAVDCMEVHDCFSITQFMITDHLDLVPTEALPERIEAGDTALGGRLPINPSGGLIGCGHPVGATGVRMLLDAQRQVTGRAGDMQVPGARVAQTLNIGGSCTTTVSFVLGVG